LLALRFAPPGETKRQQHKKVKNRPNMYLKNYSRKSAITMQWSEALPQLIAVAAGTTPPALHT